MKRRIPRKDKKKAKRINLAYYLEWMQLNKVVEIAFNPTGSDMLNYLRNEVKQEIFKSFDFFVFSKK
jgi:hypothetical protein